MTFKIFVFTAKKFKGGDFKIDPNFSSFELMKKLIVFFASKLEDFGTSL